MSAAASSSAAAAAVVAKPTFSSVVYGDVAACVSHCLAFADLAAWSSVNRDGRAAVRYKFDHCGLLSIATIPNITLENFETLCARLRGVQSILLPYAHPCLLSCTLLPRNPFDMLVSPRDPMMWRGQPGVDLLLRLMESNASSLVAVSFVPTFLRPTAGEYSDTADHLCGVLFEHAMRRDSKQQVMPCVYSLKRSVSERVVQRAMEFSLGLQQITHAPPLQYEHQFHKQRSQVDACPADACPFAPRPSELRQLSVALPFHRLPLLATAFPRLEVLRWGVPLDRRDPPSNLPHNLACLSSSMRSISGSLLNLYLDLDEDCFPKGSSLSLQLPVALQVMMTDGSFPSGLLDLQLDCPSLTALNLAMVFIRVDADGALAEHEEDSYARVPPMLLGSLEKMQHLRGLCLFDLDKPDAVDGQPLIERLTPDQKDQINAKTNALKRPSLFTDFGRLDQARLLLYSLSLMPFASSLQAFEEWSTAIGIEEMLQLFPSLAGVTLTSPYSFFVPRWLRPEPKLDPLSLPFVTFWRQQRLFRSWDRLHAQPAEETAEEFAARLVSRPPAEIPAWLSLALPDTKLEAAECSRLLQSSAMFRSLRIVYLSCPSRVDSAAVRSLLLECVGLESLSLIQLVGVGDSVFLDLPANLCRPSLDTLRIKSPCGQATNAAVLSRIGSLFPSLRHFELLMASDFWEGAQVGAELCRLLDSAHFLPKLQMLVVTEADGERIQVEAIWRRRCDALAAASSLSVSRSSDALPTLHWVLIRGPCTDASSRGQWHERGRVCLSSTIVPAPGSVARYRVLESVEPSCSNLECSLQDHRMVIATGSDEEDDSSDDEQGPVQSDSDDEPQD